MKVQINLKVLLEEKGLTLRQLSKLTGLSTQALSGIKNNKSKRIELKTIGLLSEALDCMPNDLFTINPND